MFREENRRTTDYLHLPKPDNVGFVMILQLDHETCYYQTIHSISKTVCLLAK